jgi:hypothetical protein
MKNVRQDRLDAYAAMKGPCGNSRESLDYWAKRASANSNQGERAAGNPASNGVPKKDLDPPKVPGTGKQMSLRSTASKPMARHSIDARMVAKEDKNHTGSSSYMRDVRRITG